MSHSITLAVTLFAILYIFTVTVSEILTIKNVFFENVGNGHRVQHVQWQISTSIKVTIHMFGSPLAVFKILTFQMFDLENLGQGHRAQRSEWCNSVANANLDKSRRTICFYAGSRDRNGYIKVWKVWLWTFWSRSWNAKFAMVPFERKFQPLWNNYWAYFARSHSFPDNSISNFAILKKWIKVTIYNNCNGAIP